MDLGADLVMLRDALDQQFPELGVRTLVPVAEGGDFTTVLATATTRGPRPSLVFRFPRGAATAQKFAREVALLALLGPRLPVAVPDYRWLGSPTAHVPFRFGGYPLLAGISGEVLRPARDAWPALARQVADFLGGLAAVPVADLDALGVPVVAPADARVLGERMRAWRRFFERVGEPLPPLARAYLHGNAPIPSLSPGPVLAHADLKGEHLLLDERAGVLRAVLDWTDACRGEAAVDLVGVIIWLGPVFAALVADEMGRVLAWNAPETARTVQRAVALARYGTLDRLGERLAGQSDAPLALLRTQLRYAFAEEA